MQAGQNRGGKPQVTETTSPPAAAQENPAKLPAHEIVYQKLRAQVLFGELVPGQAVTIQGLVEALEAGMTPVREAIRRLISDGALMFQGNRRVSVPLLGPQELEELIFARKTIECELARRATLQICATDIEELVTIDNALDKAISTGDVAGYLVQNYSFHTALYAHANAPILSDIADRLWLRFGPSLRVVSGRLGTQSFPDRHKDILDALRRQDPEMAALAMERDVFEGMEHVVQGLKAAN
ncbi:GntR family transcriptional regulator [Leisingera sp. ANG1]|nr:GntR family transcriptional regulator [Leisingera sp. ANG-S3]KIC33141.1 GntR family transcriptional regulator [Leisingera sp. ANG-S5]KIC53147.1 GntR family transcriptional regulator [Leisingera sp. ANG-S]KID07382.1 GntR family transcriptional regulator [Leisingera sp. ANG1]